MSAQASLTPAERRSLYTECDALAARMTELYAYLTAATYQFQCLVAEFDEKGYFELAGEQSPHQAKPTRESRRANALAEVAEAYLGREAPNGSTGDRYQVVVHVSAETSGEVPSDLPRVDRGTGVSAETSSRTHSG